MSDEEDVETFEGADAGTAEAYPMEAGQIKKGGYIMIKGHPCKVINMSTSKTGKHGHAKVNFTAIDIFTGKKMEDIVPSSHTTSVPFVSRSDYQLIEITDEDYLSLMEDSGETKDDVKLPNDVTIAEEIRAAYENGDDVMVNIVTACGTEQVMGWKKLVE